MRPKSKKWSDIRRDVEKVRIVKRGDRGLAGFGKPTKCSYGTDIDVYESSAADARYVWLSMQTDLRGFPSIGKGEASAHLSVDQAYALAMRLLAFIASNR